MNLTANCRHPQPRSGHRIVSDENYIYCFGGFNPDVPPSDAFMAADPVWRETKPLFQELWQYSKTTRTWTHLVTEGEAPRELASHCALLWPNNSTLLVYGGSGVPFGQSSSNKIHLCDLKTKKWSRVTYANPIHERDGLDAQVGFLFTHR